MHSAVYRKAVGLSVCDTRELCPHDHDFFIMWQPYDSSFLAPNFVSPHSTAWPYNSRSNTGGIGKNVGFSIKTACISETVSDTAKVTIDHHHLIATHKRAYDCHDLEWHLKVISAYVVIPTSNISEIMYDKSTKTKIANKKSHDSFQVILVQNSHPISRKFCVIQQKLLWMDY